MCKVGDEVLTCGPTYLSAASSVLCRTSSDENSLVVLDQIVVQSEMLLFGKNSIIGFQLILLEELLVSGRFVSSSSSITHRRIPHAFGCTLTRQPGYPTKGSPKRAIQSFLGQPLFLLVDVVMDVGSVTWWGKRFSDDEG